MKIVAFFRSLLTYFIIFLAGAICIIPCGVFALLPEYYRFNKIYFLFSSFFYKSAVYASFLPINIIGKENLIKEPAIYAGNHQSSIDIPVMGYLIGSKSHIWLVMAYYTRTFLLGFFVRRMNISVDSSRASGGTKALVRIIKFLDKYKDMSLVIFPEGRRIKDDRVSSFMKGFAAVAKATNRPIVPIYMPNNGRIYPVNAFIINYYSLDIVVGEPFYYKPDDTDQMFTERVHNWFVKQNKKYLDGQAL